MLKSLSEDRAVTHSEPDLSDALAFARKRADERLANTPTGDREAVSRTVAALAEAWGEDPAAIVRVIEGDSALARLVRKLHLEPVPPKRGAGRSAESNAGTSVLLSSGRFARRACPSRLHVPRPLTS